MNIDKIRAETPGTQHVAHLLASGSGLMPEPVTKAMVNHLQLEQQIGGYEASKSEVALLENATVAWCHAFYALPFKRGDKIITCEAEYAANYVAFLQRAKRDGLTISVAPNTPTGEIDVAALESMIDERVKLIAITWIPTNGGLVNPAEAVGEIASKNGIPYLLDACQAVGQMPVDVKRIKCDFLSATGRKFLRGPRGSGFLYVASPWLEHLEPAMIDHFGANWVATHEYQLRGDARRFETWENSYALRAGLGVAARYATTLGLDLIQQRAWGLADYARNQLSSLKGAVLRDIGSQQCAIVSFTIDGLDAAATVLQLRQQQVNIGASIPSSTRLDSETRHLPTVMRVAPHYYNTREEIDKLVVLLDKSLSKL